MNTKSFLVCFIVAMLATSMATAGSPHGNFASGRGGFVRNGTGSWHGGNWNGAIGMVATGAAIGTTTTEVTFNFVFVGGFGFPFFGYPYGYGYYPYGYGYPPYGYGYGSGYYGYGSGYNGYGNGYYGNSYYGNGYNGNSYYGNARLPQQLLLWRSLQRKSIRRCPSAATTISGRLLSWSNRRNNGISDALCVARLPARSRNGQCRTRLSWIGD